MNFQKNIPILIFVKVYKNWIILICFLRLVKVVRAVTYNENEERRMSESSLILRKKITFTQVSLFILGPSLYVRYGLKSPCQIRLE